MEVYESIINKLDSMLDEIENNIIMHKKNKVLINKDLNKIIKIAIDTKDFLKQYIMMKNKK